MSPDSTLDPFIPPADNLPRLGRHLRNLAYAVPLVRLALERNTLARSGLFDGVDLHYAAMALIVFLMERRTTDLGAQRQDIIAYMSQVMGGMQPNLSGEERRLGGEVVLEALSNRSEQHQAFRCELFEPGIGLVPHAFRLINVAPSEDGRILYTATNEAILLHLAMLDIDPAVAQRAEEMMLEYLVKSGRFKESLDLAERARKRSIQYQQFIRGRIFEARRSPESVRWTRDVVPELKAAASHVLERQSQERAILDAVFANKEHADQHSLPLLGALQHLVEDCQSRHSELHQELMTAHDQFLDLHAEVFRPRRSLARHDLEGECLAMLLAQPILSLGQRADELTGLLSAPRVERVLCLTSLFEQLLRPDAPGAQDSGINDDEYEDLTPPLDHFPAETLARVEAYLSTTLAAALRIDIEEVLRQAEAEGLDLRERRCAAFLMLQAYHPDENPFRSTVDIEGRFDLGFVQGSRFVFRREVGHGL